MNNYEAAINACVRTGVSERLTFDQLSAPLMEQLAFLILGTSRSTGARPEDILEIVRHKLDLKVVEHGKIGPR